MIDVSPFLAAYGLTPADLSDERKRQIGVIFTEAAKSAGGTAIQVGTRILQEEAAKRGIKTGTIGSTESTEAGKQVQAEIQKVQDEEEKAKLRKTLLISGISLVVVGVVIAVVVRLRPKSKR